MLKHCYQTGLSVQSSLIQKINWYLEPYDKEQSLRSRYYKLKFYRIYQGNDYSQVTRILIKLIVF